MPPRHASTTDIGRRSVQQDALVAVPIWGGEGHFYGVFDGHGSNGHKAAEYARIHFPKLINESKAAILANPQAGLTAVFARINEGMNEAVETVDTYMSGTTAGTIIVYSSHDGVGLTVIAANVGDSRVVLAKTGGEGVPLSVDHTCEIPEELARVKAAGARVEQMSIDGVHEGPLRLYKGTLPYPGLVVTRALGDSAASRIGVLCAPHVSTFVVDQTTDKFIILGSDGLWDGIGIKQAIAIVEPYVDIDLSLASSILNDAGLAGLDKAQLDDNITNILVSLT